MLPRLLTRNTHITKAQTHTRLLHNTLSQMSSTQTAKVKTLVQAASTTLGAPSQDGDLVQQWATKVEHDGPGDLAVSINLITFIVP